MALVDEYLASLPPEKAALVAPYWERARALVPGLTEGLSYAMVALKHRGWPLVSIYSTKAGASIYPYTGSILPDLYARHPELKGTHGALHFTEREPLPMPLFDEIVLGGKERLDAKPWHK